jgi:predicted dehydrogenase
MIGLGYAGRQQLQAVEAVPALRVVAMADPSLDLSAPYGDGVLRARDWRDLLASPQVDAVSVCVPHHLHAEIVRAALDAGKHVLVEKPLALNAAEGRLLLDAARQANRVLMVEMTHRFYPPVQQAREIVASGRLGQIYAVEDRVVEPVSDRIALWLTQRATAGGGVALTNGVHLIDRIAYACGQPLRFISGAAGWTQAIGDVEDTAALTLALADGTPTQVLVSWPRRLGDVDDELTLYGTLGTLRVRAWDGLRFEPADGPAEEVPCYTPQADLYARVRVGMTAALAEFASAVLDGHPPDPPPEAAVTAQAIVDQFYVSIPSSPAPRPQGER